MEKIILVLIIFIICISADPYGTYPIYPNSTIYASYDKKGNIIGLPKGNPSYTFDSTDKGGYLYLMYTQGVGSAPPFAITYTPSGMDYYGYTTCGILGDPSNIQIYNCTDYDIITGRPYMDSSFFTSSAALFNLECVNGDCCKSYYGLYPWNSWRTAQNNFFLKYSGLNAFVCDFDKMIEPLFCQIMSQEGKCMDNVITRSKRIVVEPCLDVSWNFVMSCSILKAVGTPLMSGGLRNYDTDIYINSLNTHEIAFVFLIVATDSVCHPYEYFFNIGFYSSSPSMSTLLLFAFGFTYYMSIK